jgi:protein O-GlcNAc transferase
MSEIKANIWDLLDLPVPVDIVDIGANPCDGDPPYKALLDSGNARLVAFEPQKEGFEALQDQCEPHTTVLPNAVGDGTEQDFYRCFSPGMSSTLKPDPSWLHLMLAFDQWGEVLETSRIATSRLDDIPEIKNIDFLKMDIQGGELRVFQNGLDRLSNAVLIQTEVSFNPLYENEPLFADIDRQLRSMGFVFHTFEDINHRCFTPVMVNDNVFDGNRHVFQADVVYVKDYRKLHLLNSVKLRKLAWLLHELYFSFDLVQVVLFVHDRAYGTKLRDIYFKRCNITTA